MKTSELKEMKAIAGSLLKVPSNTMVRLSDEYINRIIYLLSNGSEKIKQLQQENKQLKELTKDKSYCKTCEELQDKIHYKHIIDELEKWLMEENNQKYSKDIWNYSVNSWVLTKLQELKGSDKE